MHLKNLHNSAYDFKRLIGKNPDLAPYVFVNQYGTTTVDFSRTEAVLQLNRALLMLHYGLSNWNVPEGHLCPPVPSRADYIHYLADHIKGDAIGKTVKGLDIGTGANAIYAILGAQIYNWKMVGTDISTESMAAANRNIEATGGLSEKIQLRQQSDPAHIFKGILLEGEYYDFTLCNPPFHSSAEDALKGTVRKTENLHGSAEVGRNFGGTAHELWCNGGEALFIKRMIKESVAYGHQVGWFSSLVSKKEHLPKIISQLRKLKGVHAIVPMERGNKKTRFIAWKFDR
ncbi:MAG: 23S rRNA (adenine(1618)-N(6))-methyltransferase RlmF [Sediminicola sp.]